MPSAVKKIIFKKVIRLLANYTCQRWSILAPFIVYLILFLALRLASIPLRSENAQITQANTFRKLREVGIERRTLKIPDGVEPQTLLVNTFQMADINHDKFLSHSELSSYINNKTQEHINQATMSNYGLFVEIDMNPRDGVITWVEYHKYFLKQHGYDSEDRENHDAIHPEMSRDLREMIMRDKAAFGEAARSDPDHLTVDEFLAFRHPESSHASILTLVEDLLDKFDRDGDGSLTEDEFSSLQKEEADSHVEASPVEAERRREFRTMIDVSKDGLASRHELLMYIDPKNPRHGNEEAGTLILLADTDRNGLLTIDEILQKMDLFLGSKMIDTAGSFHDEF